MKRIYYSDEILFEKTHNVEITSRMDQN